ncbi:hypothetical protein [Salipaludibacillus sp. LMS25]|nr:hypothetical protein [Salipaludibacillus sp. LMS25]
MSLKELATAVKENTVEELELEKGASQIATEYADSFYKKQSEF